MKIIILLFVFMMVAFAQENEGDLNLPVTDIEEIEREEEELPPTLDEVEMEQEEAKKPSNTREEEDSLP